MAKKHLMKCSVPLVIREMHINRILRFHLIPAKMAKIMNSTAHAGENIKQVEYTSIAGGNTNLYNCLGNKFCNFPEN